MRRSVLTVPSIATAGFLWISYSVSPLGVCSSYLLSGVFLFFIGMFFAMSINGKENDVFEETLLLHSKSASVYYASRELLLLILCCIYSLVLALAPVLLCLINSKLFMRPVEATDLALGLPYIFISGFGGMELGDLCHPRIFAKRRDALSVAALISVLSLCKVGIMGFHPVLKVLNYLLPPILDGYEAVIDKNYFDNGSLLLICLHMAIYAVIMMLIKIRILTLKRFRY
jgi:hypothetical protein